MKPKQTLAIGILALISIGLSASANPICESFFQNHNQDGVVFQIADLLKSEPVEIEAVLNEFSERSIREVKDDIYKNLNAKRSLFGEMGLQVELVNQGIRNLANTNFMLSPLHQLTYLIAIEKAHEGNGFGQTSYLAGRDVLTKKQLQDVDKIMKGSTPEDAQARKEISVKMVDFFDSISFRDSFWLHSWKNSTEADKLYKIKQNSRKRYLKLDPKKTIPMLDQIAEILHQPGGKQVLAKIFEFSLTEVHTVISARARGLTGSVIKYGLPAAVGSVGISSLMALMGGTDITSFITHAANGDKLMFLTLMGQGSFAGHVIMPLIKPLYDLPDLPGRVRSFVKRKTMEKQAPAAAMQRLEMEALAGTELGNKMNETDSLISRLDIDFNRIKSELRFNKMDSILAVGKWGSEFSYASASLSERTTAVIEKINQLAAFTKEYQQELKDPVQNMVKRNQLRSKLDFLRDSIIESIAQVSAFKFDLLMLASAYDRYTLDMRQILATGGLTRDQRDLLEGKRQLFVGIEQQLKTMAPLSSLWSGRLISNLATVEQFYSTLSTDSLVKGYSEHNGD